MAMKRRRNLITSPLDWFLSANPVPPPAIPVLAERGGTQLKTPRPVLVVDTREQNPFDFSRFQGWFSGVERRALKLGDYSISGLEDICVVERKDLSDLVRSFTVERPVFVARLRQMDCRRGSGEAGKGVAGFAGGGLCERGYPQRGVLVGPERRAEIGRAHV